jgi:hypothetical protein
VSCDGIDRPVIAPVTFGMTRLELIARWRQRADDWRRLTALVDGATLIEELLADVVDVFDNEREILLTLDNAAARSGYSPDHLARLIRQHRIPNSGRRGAPRIRLDDLPIRAGFTARSDTEGPDGTSPHNAPATPPRYDPKTDARSLASRRSGAAHARSDRT